MPETKMNEWVGIEQLAEALGVPVRTIYSWRTLGKGPRGATFGKHVRFSREDINLWIAEQYDQPREAG